MTNLIRMLCAVMMFCSTDLNGQDMFNSTQVTFDAGQEGFPTWSPDGRSMVYSRISFNDTLGKTGLWKVTSEGKDPVQIYNVLAEHPRWSPDGRYIVFDADSGKSMKMISANGGPPINIIPDSFKIQRGAMPCWSPDSRQIAFLEGGSMTLCVLDTATRKVSRIFRLEEMLPIPGCWTRDGKSILIALVETKTRKSTIWKISSDGKTKNQITGHHEGMYRYIDLSPDGSLLLYGVMEVKEGKRNTGFWIMPSDGGRSIQLVSHPGFNDAPSWSPDGKKLAFGSTRSGSIDVWVMEMDLEQIKKEIEALNR